MRKRKDNNRRNQILIGGVLVAIMIFSGFGIYSNSGTNSIYYGKHKLSVSNEGRFLFMKYQGKDVVFYNAPAEVRKLAADEAVIQKLKDARFLIITFDPLQNPNNLAIIDKSRFDLQTTFGKQIIPGIVQPGKGYEFPVYNCENASSFIPVLYFNESNETSITDNNNCIMLSGNNTGMLELRDFLMYSMVGVFDEKEG